MKKSVAIERCPDYRGETVEEALEKLLGRLGGIEEFVKPGQKVLLKPNLLRKARPEEAITTHPELVKATVKLVQRAGGKAIIGDSPGAALPHSRNVLIKLYRACGMEQVAEETGAELALDTSHRLVPCPKGRTVKGIEIIQPAVDADVIINLPKFKTHVYTRLTGAVKNLFGLVPGLIKPAYHAKLEDELRFSSMLVDLLELFTPDLSIVDGVWGMEGDGPANAPRRDMGLLIAGKNAPAVDVVLGRIMGIDPLSVSTTRQSLERGLLESDLSDVEILGEPLIGVVQEGMPVPDSVASGISFARLPFWLKPALPVAKRLLTTRPRIDRKICVACGECVRVCPVEAIGQSGGRLAIAYSRCIRCYCCHETCPRGAIKLVKPLFQRIFV